MKKELVEKPKKQKEVIVTMEPKELKPLYDHAVEHFRDSVTVPGFRKGKVPKEVLKTKVEKQKLDNVVLNHLYPQLVQDIIKEYKIVPVMQPRLKIDYISEEKGLKVTFIFVERPDITLPNYKDLAKKAYKEVEKEAKSSKIVTAKNLKEAEKKAQEAPKDLSQEPSKDQKVLAKIYDLLAEKSKIELPDIMVTEETNRLLQNFLAQLAKMQIKLEDYLAHTKSTIQKIQEDYRKHAIKNLKLEFILTEISKKEKLNVTDKEVQAVIDATPDEKYKKHLQTPEQRYYIESTLLKNKVVNKLMEYSGFKKDTKTSKVNKK